MRAGEPAHYRGLGDEGALMSALLNDTTFAVVAFRNDGTIVFCNDRIEELLSYRPDDLLGTNIIELLHPEDMERAILALASSQGSSVVSGLTRFRVKHGDGSWQPIEVIGGPVHDGAEELIAVFARNGIHEVVIEDILALLLRNVPRDEVLAPVCNVIQWHGAGSQMAISWQDEHGYHQVNTPGCPLLLGGGDGRDGTPWSALRREDASAGLEGTCDDLTPELADAARALGVSLYWIEPVPWSALYPPAMVTIWTVGGTRTPQLHSYGMTVARNMVELILRWTEQMTEVSRAATLDPLTGLVNRRAFSQALIQTTGGGLLYCDLDGFKPVNDRYGHEAGDILLRLVSERIEASVREGDVVGRLGGDEFAVLCPGASREVATEIARRISAAIREPFEVDGQLVTVSVSIGVATTEGALDSEVLKRADQALFEAKQAGRATVRGAEPGSPPGSPPVRQPASP